MQDLAARLNAICDAQPFVTTFFVKNMLTGATVDRDGHRPMPSASTRKISIMMAALKAVHEGRLRLEEPITIEDRLKKDVASGTYRYMTSGYAIPLRDALVNMIITSDNVCTQMVLERLTLAEMTAFCQAVGMANTVHRHLIPPLGLAYDHPLEMVTTTTPADQAVLLELIWRGAEGDAGAQARLGCSQALCKLGLDILSWQLLRTMIHSLLPFGTKIASKGGRGRRGRMDAGMVFRDGKPLFILGAYTDQVPETMPNGLPGYSAAFATIGQLARACWDGIR